MFFRGLPSIGLPSLPSRLPWWFSGKDSPCKAGDWVQSLSQEDLREKEMESHSSILGW